MIRPELTDEHIESGTWRLDLEVNYVSFYRVAKSINWFTSVPQNSSPSTLQVLIGSYFGNARQRRALNQANQMQQETTLMSAALASLNNSQRYAARQSFAQRVLPIQGPPGTSKTHVAEVIFRLWKSIRVQGPLLRAAPS